MISVIIPTYNTALLIERTLRSVLAQTEQDFEIVVVDDGSTDDTVKCVENIADQRIRIFKQPENRGPAAARNRGLKEAKGEFCAFLDGDDYWEPEFLAETSKFLSAHPECVAVSVMQCHKIIGKEPDIAPQNTGVSDSIVLEDFFDFWAKYNHVCTGSVLMRTEIALNAGGQREELRICEDLEFWMLLALQGKWGFIPHVLFTSDGGAVTRKQGWLEKNMRRWNSAPSVEEWLKRIPAVPEVVIGRIARNLCYSHIMAGREDLARREVLHYGKFFPSGRINILFKIAAKTQLFWSLWAAFLKKREFLRDKR